VTKIKHFKKLDELRFGEAERCAVVLTLTGTNKHVEGGRLKQKWGQDEVKTLGHVIYSNEAD
jgi:hypothetical protein